MVFVANGGSERDKEKIALRCRRNERHRFHFELFFRAEDTDFFFEALFSSDVFVGRRDLFTLAGWDFVARLARLFFGGGMTPNRSSSRTIRFITSSQVDSNSSDCWER